MVIFHRSRKSSIVFIQLGVFSAKASCQRTHIGVKELTSVSKSMKRSVGCRVPVLKRRVEKFELGLILRCSRGHLMRRALPLCSASHGPFRSPISRILHTSSGPSLSLLLRRLSLGSSDEPRT